MEYDRADKEVAEMSKIKVNEQRAVDEFQELTAIDAPSFGERQMADRLIVKLKELGFEVEEDNAGKHFGGNAGNLYAYLPGDLPGDSVLLSGHMDTVEPSKGKKGIIGEDGVIRSAGKAVLGADDVAGLVEIPCIKRNVSGVSIAFTAAEMALAGIESKIPVDECIQAMKSVGDSMCSALKETALGGLAMTPTGIQYAKRIYNTAQ